MHSKAFLQTKDALIDDSCGCGKVHISKPASTGKPGLRQRKPMRAVSPERAAANRLRKKIIDQLFPERPVCANPVCYRLADDIYEPLTRARGGSIVDPANMVPLCRDCHEEVTFAPESELDWAYDLGLLVHSWNAPAKAAGE